MLVGLLRLRKNRTTAVAMRIHSTGELLNRIHQVSANPTVPQAPFRYTARNAINAYALRNESFSIAPGHTISTVTRKRSMERAMNEKSALSRWRSAKQQTASVKIRTKATSKTQNASAAATTAPNQYFR